jgi:putative transposase
VSNRWICGNQGRESLIERHCALSESVNGTLKNELVYRTAYKTRKAAMDDIARWIELRYNRTRLHSTLGYRTPQEVLDEYLNGQEAA